MCENEWYVKAHESKRNKLSEIQIWEREREWEDAKDKDAVILFYNRKIWT